MPRVYAHNAIALLGSICPITEPVAGVAAGVNANRTRMVVRHKEITASAQALLDTEPLSRRVTLEDSFSVLSGDVAPGVTVRRMPVMVRQPAPLTPHTPGGVAVREGRPAAAGYTYDDGRAVGVYLLATLPEHRGVGLGRALMTTAIANYPNRQIALVATEAGAPLYRSLGFAEVSKATWYIRAVID